MVEKYRVNLMLTAPTAVRLLKRQGGGLGKDADLSSLRALFLAGEPLDAPTARWAEAALGKPVIDHYWQTESGSPMLGLPHADDSPARKTGSPGLPAFGFDLEVVRHPESDIEGREDTAGMPCAAGEQGVIVAHYPLPPGCFSTLWENDDDFRRIYWSQRNGRWVYSTFDWGVADEDGYVCVLGRSDDVIIVAGGRLGTREIEEVMLGNDAVAEVAVLGVTSRLRGQAPVALVVLNRAASQTINDPVARNRLEIALGTAVANALGTRARPRKIVFVDALPRTRSGKVLRRLIQEQIVRTPSADLAHAVEQVHALVAAG
jgi:propionyl-CoA synthetase